MFPLREVSAYGRFKFTNYNITMFREEATTALACFHVGPLSRSNWNLKMLVFHDQEGEKLEYLEKTLEARREPTTNSPTYGNGLEWNSGHSGGR